MSELQSSTSSSSVAGTTSNTTEIPPVKVTEPIAGPSSTISISASTEETTNENELLKDLDPNNKLLDKLLNAEEYLENIGQFQEFLDYERQMFLDMAYSDAIIICAKGIDCNNVLLALFRAFCDSANLIIIINSSDYEEKYFRTQLNDLSGNVHESSSNANERQRVYLQGGIHFISTRILVVDLLKQRIPIELITGIFVLRAHTIIESCQEAFALRLYRQSNKTGFIKAFTNSPESFTFGYGHVEKVMRNLFLKELYIWPRFHATIKKSLKIYEPQIIELHIPMTIKMKLIQTHILDIMNYLVTEIKRLNRFVDMQEITVENCITKKFHKILQVQLDCVWHQLSGQTKQLIADLKVLRSLMISTIYNDSVSLYSLMKKYRTASYAMNNSGWTLLDAAEQIFKISRERVFNDTDEFEPEPSPKWRILSEILRVEIPNDVRKLKKDKHKSGGDDAATSEPIKVLILCQDSRTCYQLNQYLLQGPERYLFYTAIKNDIQIAKISESYKKIQKENDSESVNLQNLQSFLPKVNTDNVKKCDASQQSGTKESLENQSVKSKFFTNKNETTTLRSQKIVKETTATNADGVGKKIIFLKDRIAKRKLEAEEAELGKLHDDDGDGNDGEMVVKDKELEEFQTITKDDYYDGNYLFRESYVLTINETLNDNENDGDDDDDGEIEFIGGKKSKNNTTQYEFESFAELENLDMTLIGANKRFVNKPILCIQTFKSNEDGPIALEKTLQEMNPQYIIMYHCNVTAIRQIEVYEGHMKRAVEQRSKVFFLIHSQTIEEQSYLTNLRRENQAFDLLIETKSKMVIPEYQDGKTDDTFLIMQTGDVEINTRNAGGQINSERRIPPKIIVDMREFRSDLPCLIHKRGIHVVPLTITIGDYILTPDICVERKSISDLIGSLNSGRLYNQCVQMTRHYKKPILLIEFDQNKPFYLQGHYMISGESTSNVDIIQKLQLLTMYFPKLRLVWSPSPYATAQLFEELKHGKDEPDSVTATSIGRDTAKDLEIIIDQINSNLYDFLLRLPGINSRNINNIIKKVKNLKELLKYSEKQLADLLGSEANAKMLYEIFHVTHRPIQADAANEKQFQSKYKRGRGGGSCGIGGPGRKW